MEIRLKWNLQNQKRECVKGINKVRKRMYIQGTQNRRYSTFFVDKTAIVRANISLSSSGPSITVTFPRCFKPAWASCLFLFSREINDRMKSSACPTDVWRPLDQTSITCVNSGLALGVVPASFKQSGRLSPLSSSRPISNSRVYRSVSPLYGPL